MLRKKRFYPSEDGEVIGEPEIEYAYDEKREYYDRQNVGDVRLYPASELESFAGVGFREEVVKSPAVTAYAEQNVAQRTKREHTV